MNKGLTSVDQTPSRVKGYKLYRGIDLCSKVAKAYREFAVVTVLCGRLQVTSFLHMTSKWSFFKSPLIPHPYLLYLTLSCYNI